MKALPVMSMAVAVVALILALVALATAPEGAGEVRSETAVLGRVLEGVSSRLGEAETRLDALDELDARLGKVSRETSRLGRSLTAARERAAGPAPERAQVDEARLRELVREEMGAQVEQFRRGMRGMGRRDVSAQALREGVGLEQEKAERIAQIRRRMREATRNIWREGRDRGHDKNIELMRELQKKAEEEIAEFLTPEEMGKYRELINRGGRGRRGGREGRGRERHGGEKDRPAGEEGGGGDDAF